MDENRLSQVASQLKRLFLDRIRPQEPLLINLDGDPVIHRLHPDLPTQVALREAMLSHRLRAWEPAVRLSRMLTPIFSMLDEAAGGPQWRETLLTFAAAHACLWAARLAEQLGASPACSIRSGVSDQALSAAMSNTHGPAELTGRTAMALIQKLTRPPAGCADREKAKTLRLERHPDDSVRAVWLTATDEILCEASLDNLIQTVCEGFLSHFVGEGDRLRSVQYRQRATEFLQAVCPEFAQVRRHVLQARQPLGYWMFAGSDALGTSYDVCLFIEPVNDNHGAVHLCVRRVFAEFVLQDATGRLWYFPPGQLQGRVVFGAAPGGHLWWLAHPEIRLPPEAPRWIHPFTGDLRLDPFSNEHVLNHDPSRAQKLPPISREVLRYLPQLAQPAGVARVNDMCIPAQDGHLERLVQQVRQNRDKAGQFDVLTAVRGVLGLGKQGLTRAHEQNKGTPRASFDGMFYLLRPEVLAQTNLRKRVYCYTRK